MSNHPWFLLVKGGREGSTAALHGADSGGAHRGRHLQLVPIPATEEPPCEDWTRQPSKVTTVSSETLYWHGECSIGPSLPLP
jgi:hypothetical protein